LAISTVLPEAQLPGDLPEALPAQVEAVAPYDGVAGPTPTAANSVLPEPPLFLLLLRHLAHLRAWAIGRL